FSPTFTGGDTNGNGLLDPTETWTYTATRIATAGQYTNFATVQGNTATGIPVTAIDVSNHFGDCPDVVNVTLTGSHPQPTPTVQGNTATGIPVTAIDVSNHFGECPEVVNVTRFGIHHQPTQIVLTFNGALDPAQAQNLANYRLVAPGPDGKFGTADDRVIPI